MIWIGILFVLLLAADYSLLCKKDISFTLPVSGFTLVFLSYILSWTELFSYFVYIVDLIILLFSFYAGFVFIKSKDKKQRLKAVLSPGLIGYLILCVVAFRVSHARFCQWDEFSHWGTVVKDMFYSKRLGIYPDSVSAYKTYPPGAALWELYFASCFREWNDWPVIFAYNLLMIQWMMPLFGCLRRRGEERKGWLAVSKCGLLTIIFVVIVYLVPYLYYSPFEGIAWRCIYVDRALGIGFAWMLFMHFGTETGEKDRFYYFSFALGAGFQCLLKGTGVCFVLMALLLIIPDVILTGGAVKRKILNRYGTACIFPLLTILTWYTGLRFMNVSSVWKVSGINIGTIIKLISGQEEPWRYDVIKKFPAFLTRVTLQFYHGGIILTIPAYLLFWIAGAGFVSALNGRRNKNTDKRNFLIALTAFLEFIIYESVVLLTELYVLTPTEAQQMSSVPRYSAEFCIGLTCFLIFYVISYLFSESDAGKQNDLYFLLLLCFLFGSVSVEKAMKDLADPVKEAEESYRFTNFTRYNGIEEKIGTILTPENSCYILSEDDPYGHFVLRKQLIPVRTNSELIDSDTENQCEAFLKEILFNSYDHVFVNSVNEEFNDSCKGLFENKTISELSLYRVNMQDGFKLELAASF